MITTVTQVWRARRASYRPAGEPFDPRQYEVAEAWRAELRAAVAAHARPADPPAVVRWRCACGAEVESYGAPAEPRECGPCEIKRQSVTDMSRLGGRR